MLRADWNKRRLQKLEAELYRTVLTEAGTTNLIAAILSGTPAAKLLTRFPWLALIGAGLIGWIAGDVIAGEGRIEQPGPDGNLVDVVQPGSIASWLDLHIPHAELVCSVAGAVLVLALGMMIGRLKDKPKVSD